MSGLNRFTSSTVTTASNGGDGFTSLNISGGVISPRRSSRSQEAGLASFQACAFMVQWQCIHAKCLVWTKLPKGFIPWPLLSESLVYSAELIIIIIINVFVKHKIVSIETILSAYTHTHTHTHSEAPAHMSIMTIQS